MLTVESGTLDGHHSVVEEESSGCQRLKFHNLYPRRGSRRRSIEILIPEPRSSRLQTLYSASINSNSSICTNLWQSINMFRRNQCRRNRVIFTNSWFSKSDPAEIRRKQVTTFFPDDFFLPHFLRDCPTARFSQTIFDELFSHGFSVTLVIT